MNQSPMTALAFEVHAGHMQSAVAHITNRNVAVSATAGIHATEDRRAGHGELTGRGMA